MSLKTNLAMHMHDLILEPAETTLHVHGLCSLSMIVPPQPPSLSLVTSLAETNLCDGLELVVKKGADETPANAALWAGLLRGVQMAGTEVRGLIVGNTLATR